MKTQTNTSRLRLRLLLIVGLTYAFPHEAFLQSPKNYDGYVVTVDADTIKGKLQVYSPIYNQLKLHFTDNDANEYVYETSELLSYCYFVEHDDTVISVNYKRLKMPEAPIQNATNEVWVYQATHGAVNLYVYYIEDENSHEVPLRMQLYVYSFNGDLVEVNKHNYKELVIQLFDKQYSTNPQLLQKRYNSKELIKEIKIYNKWATTYQAELYRLITKAN